MSHVFHGKSEEAEEGAAIGLAARTLRAAGAQRVRGWLSPIQSESHVTLDLLSENGFDYTLDWNVDDLPLAMHTRKAPIYGVPYALDINDRQSVHEFNLSNDEYVEQLLDSFRTLWEEAGQYGGRVMTISANGWLTGQANRIAAFRRAMTEICAHPGVWPTTCSGMLDAYRAQS
jgi:peptidoglycan/xylan/chitin deacetylase (PgdA/CDA1 family)